MDIFVYPDPERDRKIDAMAKWDLQELQRLTESKVEGLPLPKELENRDLIDRYERLWAIEALTRKAAPGTFEFMEHTLQTSQDIPLRCAIIASLPKLSQERAIPVICNTLSNSEEFWLIIYCQKVLKELKDESSIPLLKGILTSAHTASKSRDVIEVLQEFRSKEILDFFCKLLLEQTKFTAYTNLRLIDFSVDIARFLSPDGAEYPVDREYLEFICGLLQHSDLTRREVAVEALRELKDRRAVDDLLEALELKSGSTFELRCNIIRALQEIGDPKAIPPLKKLRGNVFTRQSNLLQKLAAKAVRALEKKNGQT